MELKMIQENELVMLLIGIGVLIFLLRNHDKIKQIPSPKLFFTSFLAIFTGWSATVFESFFLNDFLNLIEHLAYTTSSLLIATWCWQVFFKNRSRLYEPDSDS